MDGADGQHEATLEEQLEEQLGGLDDRALAVHSLARLICIDDSLHRLEAIFAQLVAKG